MGNDYQTISVEEFVVESIELKMRWLGQRLHCTDKPAEICEWVKSMTSLHNLLINVRAEVVTYHNKIVEQNQTPHQSRNTWTISNPLSVQWESEKICYNNSKNSRTLKIGSG